MGIDRERLNPGAQPSSGPGGEVTPNGAPSGARGPVTPSSRNRSGRARLVILPLLLIVLAAASYFGYGYYQDQMLYVSTDNAYVTGALIQVGSLNAGRVSEVSVDIGQHVMAGQSVATVMLPSALATTASGTPKMGFRGTDDQMVSVESPVDGVVVSRQVNPGDTIAAGQPLLTVVEPSKLWVQAQIEETKVGRVHVGQTVAVTLDALGRTLPGKVVAVNEATAGTFSLLPQGNTSGNFTKVTQLVPVKIAVDYGEAPLVLGSSAEVKIRVQD